MGEEGNKEIDRLTKLVDRQDKLLSNYDAKFEQQNELNKMYKAENDRLKKDLEEHKKLLSDMKKSLTQHKNVVNQLRKELEGQLKLQQDLHKEYGEIVEDMKKDYEASGNSNPSTSSNDSNSSRVKLPPRDFDNSPFNINDININDSISRIAEKIPVNDNLINNSQFNNQSEDVNKQEPSNSSSEDNVICPNCGSSVAKGAIFCKNCGCNIENI